MPVLEVLERAGEVGCVPDCTGVGASGDAVVNRLESSRVRNAPGQRTIFEATESCSNC